MTMTPDSIRTTCNDEETHLQNVITVLKMRLSETEKSNQKLRDSIRMMKEDILEVMEGYRDDRW